MNEKDGGRAMSPADNAPTQCGALNESNERCIYGHGHPIAHHRFESEVNATIVSNINPLSADNAPDAWHRHMTSDEIAKVLAEAQMWAGYVEELVAEKDATITKLRSQVWRVEMLRSSVCFSPDAIDNDEFVDLLDAALAGDDPETAR